MRKSCNFTGLGGTQRSTQRDLQQLLAWVTSSHSASSLYFREPVSFLRSGLKKTGNVQRLWKGKWSASQGELKRVCRARGVKLLGLSWAVGKKNHCMRGAEGEMRGFTCRVCCGGMREAFFWKGKFPEKIYFGGMGTSEILHDLFKHALSQSF